MEVVIMTPTQFIREAALKNLIIPVAMGKTVEYYDVSAEPTEDTRCWLCGGETNGYGISIQKAIKDTFTNQDMSRSPESKTICTGCAFCLGQRPLRNYSILATIEKLQHPTRPEIRNVLLCPPEPPFLLCIAVSGQKHLHFRGQIAYSRENFPVQLEETRIYVNRPVLEKILSLAEELYTVFSKDEITTGKYGQNRIKQFGLADFQRVEGELSLYRGTRLFELALFVAQKQEQEEMPKGKENEKKCYTISTLQTTQAQLALF